MATISQQQIESAKLSKPEYVGNGAKNPMTDNVFISYRRKNVDFVKNLVDQLEQNGRSVWVDWADIPPGSVGFANDIKRGIEGSDAFLCVLSPEYLESEYTKMELDYAIELNKKLIPIVHSKFDGYEVPSGIGHINWIYFVPHAGQENTFDESFPKIIAALDTDLDHVRNHTKLLNRAMEWEGRGRPDGLVLRGDDLDNYYQWWSASTDRSPKPTQLQTEYILASRKAAERRRRLIFSVLIFGLIFSVTLSIIAVLAMIEANRANAAAQREEATARSLLLADQARSNFDEFNDGEAVALALIANRISDDPPAQAQQILSDVAYTPGTDIIIDAHDAAIYGIDVREDGSAALTGSFDGQAIYWDLTTGEEISRYSSSDLIPVRSVLFHPTDPNVAVIGMLDWSIVLWDLRSGETIQRLGGIRGENGHRGAVNSLAISSDGRRMISGSSDGTLILWNLETGSIISRYGGFTASHDGPVRAVTLNESGTIAVSGAADGTAIIWDLTSGRINHRLRGHSGEVYDVTISPNGEYLLTSSRDRTAILWDVETGDLLMRFVATVNSPGHTAGVRGAEFLPDENNIVTSGEDGSLIVWDLQTGRSIFQLFVMDESAQELNIAITGDGRTVLTGSNKGNVTVWDISNEAVDLYFEGHQDAVSSVVYSPDGKLVATGSYDFSVILWDGETSEILANYGGHNGRVNTVAFSQDGSLLASGADDGQILVRDVESGEVISTIPASVNAGVTAVRFTQDGQSIIGALDNNTLRRWNTMTGEILNTYSGHERRVLTLDISPDGQTFASGGADGHVIIWNITSGNLVHELAVSDSSRVLAVSYSPDGQVLASGSIEGDVQLWNTVTAELINDIQVDDDSIWALDFSPDGQNMVSGTAEGKLILWDVDPLRQLRIFTEHRAAVVDVTFSPDGASVVTASRDRTALRWEMPDLESLIAWTAENRHYNRLSCQDLLRYGVELETCLADGLSLVEADETNTDSAITRIEIDDEDDVSQESRTSN